MATAYSKPFPKKAWQAPGIRKLEGAEADRARQIMIARGLIPAEVKEKE